LNLFSPVKRLVNKLYQITLVSTKLGSGIKSTTQLFFWGCFKSVFDYPNISPKNPIAIRFRNNNYLYHFRNYSDFGLAYEILVENSYKLDHHFCCNPKNIVDLGANSGMSAIYLNSLFPNATVHCYEPDPHTFSQFQLNTAKIRNISGYQEVVSDAKGHVEFLADPKSNVTSSIIRRNSRQIPITVKSRCLNSVINKIGAPIDLLKIDIEGSEEVVFRSFENFSLIRNLVGELHFDLCDAQSVLEKLHQHYENIQLFPFGGNRCYVIASNPVTSFTFNFRNEVKRTTAEYLVDQAV
jgi:FkbM family methyltransferase